MKRITMFVLVAVAMMLSAVQARPLSETKWLLEGRRYAGEWEERVDGETLKLSFLPDGHGVFSYRGSMQPFSWTADGKGKIKGFDKPKGGRQVLDITYIPEEDVMDCGFGTNKTSLGFTGRCAFKSETLSDEVVKFRTQLAEDMPKTLEEQFERLKKSGDTRLKQVTNLGELINPAKLVERRVSIETVDLEYPRILTDEVADSNVHFTYIIYGAHERWRVKEHEIPNPREWFRSQIRERPPTKNERGVDQDAMAKMLAELQAAEIKAGWFYNNFKKGFNAWREDGIYCYIIGNDKFEKAGKIFEKYFTDTKVRYILETKVDE